MASLAASFLGVSARDAQAAPTATPARKVARFISAETAKSKLQLAEGQLPELHLREGNVKEKKEAKVKSNTVNPLVLFGALAFSVACSIILVMVDFSPPDKTSAKTKGNARVLVKKFFADEDTRDPNTELKPYQILLRQAQQAHSRGDYATERECYRRVLNLIRAERGTYARGLTGSPKRDRELEKHVTTLLGKGDN